MLKKIDLTRFLLFLFLFLHIIPFVVKENYQFITILNYSLIIFLLFISSFNNKKISTISIIFIVLIFISTLMSVFGYSGTISSLILAASIPHFLFSNIETDKDFLKLFYKPIILCSCVLILFSIPLYIDVKDILIDQYYLGRYFVTASINYCTLVFNAFCIILYLLFRTKTKYVDKKIFYSLFLFFFISLSVFFSIIFLTRTVFVCSLIILFAYFKKIRKYIVLIVPIIIFYYYDTIFLEVVTFFGSDTVTEIASDNQRLDSVTDLIISQINFDFDFRNKMSYSSLINLIFSLFPLTLVFIYNPFKTLILILKRRDFSLLLAFSSSFILVIYQMDFLSIFSFFFLINYADKFLKYNSDANKVN